MFGLGAGEILVIFFISVIILGPEKIPKVARMLGKALSEFQNAKNDLMNEINKSEEGGHSNQEVDIDNIDEPRIIPAVYQEKINKSEVEKESIQ